MSDLQDPQVAQETALVTKSKRQLMNKLISLAKKHELCEYVLGLDNGSGACFGYQLGNCRGACVGKEETAVFNHRVTQAFSHSRISVWPYPGAIVIYEQHEQSGKEAYHLIDNWCVVGSVENKDSLAALIDRKTNLVFDYDVYLILRQYLKRGDLRVRSVDQLRGPNIVD